MQGFFTFCSVYFNHLTRDEAELDLKVRMDNYEPENKNFTYSQTGEKIGTGLLASYHADIAGKNVMMKELRRNEKLKRKTERMIARAVEKKTGNQQDIAVWPPPEFPDAEKVLSKEEPKPEPVKTPEPSEEKVEFKKRKVPAGLAKRLAAKRKAAGLPELEVAKPEPNIDVAKAEEAAKAALGEMANFSIPGMDVDKLKKLLAGEKVDEVKPKPSAPPGLKPGETAKKSGGVNYVNMPSEVPLSIPGLPAGWKFGDEMPTGFVAEPEPEKQNVALEIAQSTQRKRKRPDQPVIFQKDAMGALVDPTRFNTQIEQENLTPKQPGYYIQKRKEEQAKRDAHEAMMRQTSAKVISSGPQMSSTDQYTSVSSDKLGLNLVGFSE